jgi:hypothetical protein
MTKVRTELTQYNNYQGYELRIPAEARCLFPEDKERFTMKTSSYDLERVCVTMPPSHPRPHIHIPKAWVQASRLTHKDTVVIEVAESEAGKCYHIL